MFKANKIKSTTKPKKFESLNNGIWYYNYDITEETVMTLTLDNEEKEIIRYEYIQARVSGEPTVLKCYEAILKQFKDEKGITLYNAKALGLEEGDLSDDILHLVKVDFELEEALTPLEQAKQNILKEIDEYDSSEEVNSFFLNGAKVWLDKDTRVGLMNSLAIEKGAGKEISTLWFNNICINISCEAAIQMLSALELYALECYNKTAEHKVNIENLQSEEAVLEYNYTEGYPEKLNFNI